MVAKSGGRGAKASGATGEDGLAWTRSQRKKLRGPLHPHPLDPKDRTPSAHTHWHALVARFRAGKSLRRRPAQAPTSALRERVARVYAGFESGEIPDVRDHDEELVRAAIAWFDHENSQVRDGSIERALVGLWARLGGAAFAVEVIARESAGFEVGGTYSPMNYFEVELLLPRRECPAFALRRVEYWSALRPYVVEINPASEEYRAARAAAAAARGGGDPWLRSGVALAFPRERDWSAEEAERGAARMAAQKGWPVDGCWPALASLADPALAQRLADCAAGPHPGANYTHIAADYVLDMVDVLGPAAAGPLATLLRGAFRGAERSLFASALVLASPDAARDALETIEPPPARAALAKALGG
jgi:hypothetical protein